MIHTFTLQTQQRNEMTDITDRIENALRDSAVREGRCLVFVPHTTAAVTINENADPDVCRDLLDALNRLAPAGDAYRHREGNADAHIKAALLGTSQTVLIRDRRLVLGTWQSVFFCEFDGPRRRTVLVNFFSP